MALQTLFGEEFEDEMKATLTPAPLDLRVNVFLSDFSRISSEFPEIDYGLVI